MNLQVLSPVERMGDPAGVGARLHAGRRAAIGRLVRPAEPGLAAGRRARADPRVQPRPRPPAADRRVRRKVRQELARREPRICEV